MMFNENSLVVDLLTKIPEEDACIVRIVCDRQSHITRVAVHAWGRFT